nr:MAG TPA: hypothetical protein [Caudoviricetes sp.]
MRVKIKVGDNKIEFNMSKSQALLIVKMAQEFEKSVHDRRVRITRRCRF